MIYLVYISSNWMPQPHEPPDSRMQLQELITPYRHSQDSQLHLFLLLYAGADVADTRST